MIKVLVAGLIALAAFVATGVVVPVPTHAAITEAALSQKVLGIMFQPSLRYLDPFPASVTQCAGGFHAGIDFPAPLGTDVRSATGGRVLKVNPLVGGVWVYDGANTIVYLHMSSTAVNPGDPITAGKLLGKVGHQGIATGDHLHLEVRKGSNEWAKPCTATKQQVQESNLNPLLYLN